MKEFKLTDDQLDNVSGGAYACSATRYTITEGDTVAGVAAKFGTTEQKLREYNANSLSDPLTVGRTIMIPR